MFEISERSLTESERRVLRATLAHRRKQHGGGLSRSILVSTVVCGALCVLTLLASNAPRVVVLAFWGAFALALATWLWIEDRRHPVASVVPALERVLELDRARVVHIRAEAMVELEEIEDEGACYAFQVDERRIVIVEGQDFYPSAKFPNSDFSLVNVLDDAGREIEMVIAKHGAKLAPVRTIPRKMKERLDVPEHLTTLEGRLADLETLLAAH